MRSENLERGVRTIGTRNDGILSLLFTHLNIPACTQVEVLVKVAWHLLRQWDFQVLVPATKAGSL